MKLNHEVLVRISRIAWFSNCGVPTDPGFPVTWVAERAKALRLLESEFWEDVRTEAQGDLTGYLARIDYASYGVSWNSLGQEAKLRIEQDILPSVRDRIVPVGLPDSLMASVSLDLTRVVLEASYRTRFPKAPVFFRQILVLYEKGHLPCGWDGSFDYWPQGHLMAF